MTFLFNPGMAWDALFAMEKEWGGTPIQRMEAKYAAYSSKYGTTAPKVDADEAVETALTKSENAGKPAEDFVTEAGAARDSAPPAASSGGAAPHPGTTSSPAAGAASPTPVTAP